MFNEFFKGFVKIHILHHAAEGPVYGLQIVKELGQHGYTNLSPGTLYPTLHGLEEAGYLVSEQQVVEGRWRKYYRITPAGRKALSQIRTKLAELAQEVLAG
ncbi:MAG TPA: PadR family transcriptional regulator [Anaerolineae bacterium]